MTGVGKSFGATVALSDVSLSVRAGSVHALVGENGAGKSTLMKILSGALAPDTGALQLDGVPYRPRNPCDGRRAGVAMIYQELALAPHLSVQDNILLGVEPRRYGLLQKRLMTKRSRAALQQLGHGEINPETRVGTLSIAEQQLVEIARAIAIGCRVLVLDEPTSSLARKDVDRLFALIGRLRREGMAIVYISHFIEEVREVADCFTVLRDGNLAGHGETASTSVDDIVAMMVGRRLEHLYGRSHHEAGPAALASGEPILDVHTLRGVCKPTSATLSLHRGEVLGIAGLVGAGRTELLRALFGLDAIRNGSVTLAAYAGPASPAQRWAQGMGMLSEDRSTEGLAQNLSLVDNLTLSRLPRWVRASRQQALADHWIRELGIRCQGPNQIVGSLSGGNQQKVALARLLYHEVDVLLLDEPTRGIDVASKAQIYALIDAQTERGKAILVVSSYLPELLGICDRIAVMCRGRLESARPVSAWSEQSLMTAATGAAA